MKQPVVIIGIGQMGGVFARGFLGVGHPVFPILRGMSIQTISEEIEGPALVLVAVAEDDLARVLGQIPERWKDRVGLLQNELLPRDWQEHAIEDPTVVAVWFEKKFRRPVTPLIPSPIYGPRAELVAEALSMLEIPFEILEHYRELVSALVMKNLYILTANIAGLQGADTVGALLKQDRELTRAVFNDVLALQEELTGRQFHGESMWQELEEIFESRPGHGSTGRSAPQRLKRALEQAESVGLELDALQSISRDVGE